MASCKDRGGWGPARGVLLLVAYDAEARRCMLYKGTTKETTSLILLLLGTSWGRDYMDDPSLCACLHQHHRMK